MRVTPDALTPLYKWTNQVFAGESVFYLPTSPNIMLETIIVTMEESNGNQSQPWDLVKPGTLDALKFNEDDSEQDSTSTRVYCFNPTALLVVEAVYSLLLYPTPVSGRTGHLKFIAQPSESATVDLPSYLQNAVEDFATYRAASFGSHDIDAVRIYKQLYEDDIRSINEKFKGMFGLDAPKSFNVVDVMGYDGI